MVIVMVYTITDFGARVSDLLQTGAIQKAIDECFLNGGGEVVIPAGVYRTGGLRLRSHVTLHLLSGAILEASEDPEDYATLENDTLEPVTWDDFQNGISLSAQPLSRWNHGIIRAVNATDIGIKGEPYSWIDGKNCFDPEGEEGYRGPHGINLWLCKNVTLSGYTIRNTGNWAHAVFRSENINVENITVYGGHDGFDAFLSKNVNISDCRFFSGDDSIAGYGSEHVRVQDCILNSSCSAIRFGGADVIIQRCKCISPTEFAFRGSLPLEKKRLGAMAGHDVPHHTLTAFLYYCDKRFGELPLPRMGNILIRDCVFENVMQLFNMDFGNHIWCCGKALTSITFENCRATGLMQPIYIHGDPEDPIVFNIINTKLSASAETDSEIFMDAEFFDTIHLENVKPDGYADLEIILRSDGKLETPGSAKFKVKKGEGGKSAFAGR